MKKLLITTDLSDNATHAAEYGYLLAKQIKANITLCNAFIVPALVPQAGVVVWPMEEYDVIVKGSEDGLKEVKDHLQNKYPVGYNPTIALVNEVGGVTDVVGDIIKSHNIDLVVMGTHGNTGLSTLLLGNHSRQMIEKIAKPLLLVPREAKIAPAQKIAYATDLEHPQADLAAIYLLIPLAKALNAEILVTHILNEEHHSASFQKWLDDLLVALSNKADYPNIYYRTIKDHDPVEGLEWLCQHGRVDMLAMLHRPRGFFAGLINSSHTQKIAGRISVPLLVFPQTNK